MIAYAFAAAAASAAPMTIELAQLVIRQRVIIRVPTMAPPAPLPQRQVRWKEKKGPKCLPMATLAGAAITQADSVDLYLRGGARIRAKLEQACPALDYYQGFYITPNKDGMICIDRDMIHSRAGGRCGIDKFKVLVPDR